MDQAIQTARERLCVVPRHIFVYMDDCFCIVKTPPTPRRLGLRSGDALRRDPTEDFLGCLNSVHPRVQFTKENEEDSSIAFLDVYVTRQNDGRLSTRIYRKPSNTNIGLKPQSCQDPKIVVASFKGELCRCYRLCTSLEQAKKEVNFTLDLFEDNGHDRSKLRKIADSYEPPAKKRKNDHKDKTKKRSRKPESPETQVKDLFRALPFRSEEDMREEEEEEEEDDGVIDSDEEGMFRLTRNRIRSESNMFCQRRKEFHLTRRLRRKKLKEISHWRKRGRMRIGRENGSLA